ncbi:MAG: MFS transporter [Planctomycetes bacterium]|nr:MFS transporter [Planctomycetota bacterium]
MPTSSADETIHSASPREGLAVVALALAAFSLNLNTNVLGALLPFVREDLGLEDGAGKVLVAAAAAGSALGALAVGPLAAAWGRRRMLVVGLSLFTAASVAHLWAASFFWFALLRGVSGVAVGVAYAAASALVAEVVPYERRGGALGRFTAGMFLAIPIGMPLSVVLANHGAWRGIFLVQAAIGGLACWWSLRAVPVTAAVEQRGSTRAVLRNGPAMAALLATLLHVGSFFTTVQLATSWLDDTGRVAKEDQIWVWVALGTCSVLGSALLGRAADRYGKRAFVLATSVVLVLCFGLLAREPEALPLAAVGVLLAVVAAARTGPLQALVSGLVPAHELGALMGMRGFAMQMGVAGFALAAVPIGAQAGFSGVLWFAAACQVLSYLAIRVGVRRAR